MISLHQGDILTANTEVIVNPANSFLRHGGGLARIIADAAAPLRNEPGDDDDASLLRAADHLWQMEQEDMPPIPTGGVCATDPGRLPFAVIIHAVGPIWGGGLLCEHALLEAAYINSIELAISLGYGSIAFPAISAGIFGFPIDGVAECARRAMWKRKPEDFEAQFWLFSDEHAQAFSRAFGIEVSK